MPGLKDVFHDEFLMGAAVGGMLPDGLSPAELELLMTQFNAITPENCMKPAAIQPREGVFTFAMADALTAFARAHAMAVTAHCLIWHEACPDWFFVDEAGAPAGRKLALARMEAHIHALAGRYRGQVKSWDVINEVIDDEDGYIRPSRWTAVVGDDVVEQAFAFAHDADPGAELIYNDYNIELPAKREKTLHLLRGLQAQGLRLDGVGIQGHWELDKVPYRDIEDAILAYRELGIQVMFTEVDIDVVERRFPGANITQARTAEPFVDPYPDGCPPEVLARQAEQYGELFRLFSRYRDDITRVTFWCLHDGRSWLNKWPQQRTNYPLLFDRACRPKPAYYAVVGR